MLVNVPETGWLHPEEQAAVVAKLLSWGLIKTSDARDLPLKSGGTTDVYINLRDARNYPDAIRYVAELFEYPLRRLGVSRFIEVPNAVSCFAGPLAISTGLPYLTIREQEKQGRVGDAQVIGRSSKGEVVTIIDDVITDGASKIVPIQQCVSRNLNLRALTVLVDRQQGWQKMFAQHGISVPVWSGMTLHDVRKHLIQTLGVMKRCSPEAEEKNPIIVAFDGKPWSEILPLMDRLRRTGCIIKVNDLLFAEGIDHLLPELHVYGRVMVDIKGHDIPNTLKNICQRLIRHKPWAITVHGSGGREMIETAVKTLQGIETKVLVVTVLTSMQDGCEEVYSRKPMEQVKVLAKIAYEAGAEGLVCSPEEVGELRALYPTMTLVTPGIRSIGADAGDQKRIATPQVAIAKGSNHLVMGRQILDNDDPIGEVYRVLKDELGIILPA